MVYDYNCLNMKTQWSKPHFTEEQAAVDLDPHPYQAAH